LLQGLLWSDPSTWNGIHHNTTRTIGVFYGPDVVANFLTHHNLKYLVRGHEVAEHGANVMACGRDGQSVITVFSHSEYPNGEGSNLGAYVNLHKSGEHDLVTFSRASKFLLSADNKLNPKDPYVETLKSLIASNKHNLERTFSSVAPDGSIQASKWANVMADSLELPDVPWLALIPSLAPQSNDDLEHIDWRAFLQLYVPSAGDRNCADTNINMEILHANHQMLITVYNFLDFDGDGRVDLEEFKTGVELLNKRLPEDRQIRDPVAMFRRIDRDGHGAFDMEEFEEVFRV
jgi:Ca2+-binding EF-hand superfamily protein